MKSEGTSNAALFWVVYSSPYLKTTTSTITLESPGNRYQGSPRVGAHATGDVTLLGVAWLVSQEAVDSCGTGVDSWNEHACFVYIRAEAGQ